MNFAKVIKAYGSDEFADILIEELEADPDRVPTECACDRNGMPEEVSVYEVKDAYEFDGTIHATISVSFTECVNTSCGDVVLDFPHDITCNVSICKVMEEMEIELVEVEYEPEF